MLMSLLFFACADEVHSVSVSGTDGIPQVTWTGANAETLRFTAVDGKQLWSIAPTNATECTNPLSGRQGVVWGELPDDYSSFDDAGEALPAIESLEDGSYSMGVAICDEISPSGGSYQNRGASFTITAGVIEQLLFD
ncbi:MAG: hypothetical protein ACI9VR_001095 [Cognaticolwellia sp.]|jgi:hypothetical protein